MFKKIFSIFIFLLLNATFSFSSVTMKGMTFSGIDYINADPLRIMCVGDSITLGLTDTPALFGYRDHLQDLLGIGTYDFVGPYTDPDSDLTYDVDHWGVSGARTAYILTAGTVLNTQPNSIGIDSALSTYMPLPNNASSKVLLFIGTNDSAASSGNNNPPPVTPTDATANVVSIVNKITAYDDNIEVYVALITPHRGFGSVKNNTNFINYNNVLGPAILAIHATNPNIHLVDMYHAYTNDTFGLLSGDYLHTAYSDDTHPNNLGYTVIAKQWFACIQNPLSVNCDGN